jgi:hypothetical protein
VWQSTNVTQPHLKSCLTSSRPTSLRNNACHAPPEIAPRPSAALPRIRIHNLKCVLQPGLSELRDIRRRGSEARGRVRRAPALVQIELIGGIDREGREVGGCGGHGRGRIGRAGSDGSGDTWVGGCDKIAPDC